MVCVYTYIVYGIYIVEYYSAIKKRLKFCLVQQHG